MAEELTSLLRSGTAAVHAEIEALLYSGKLMGGTLSRSEFAHLLQIHLQFHLALERAIDRHKEVEVLLPVKTSKSEMLLKDLEATGQVPIRVESDRLSQLTVPQLIGALYVSEGSMLGGAVIARAIAKTQGLQDHKINFFGMYGKDLGPNWVIFCNKLNDRPNAEWPLILEGAHIAFNLYRELYHTTTTIGIHG